MSKPRKYRLRAECIYDVTRLILSLPTIDNITINRTRFPDCEVSFTSEHEIEKLCSDIKGIKELDVHIMYETLERYEFYTGKRIRSCF